MFAAEIRRKRVQQLRAFSKWKWHVDEVFVKVNGKRHYLRRAVDHEGEVLEAVVTKRRNKQAALKSLKKLMKRHSKAENVVTDRFASCRFQRACCYRKTANGQVVQQPRREFIPSFPTTRTRDAAIQAYAKFTEVRRRPLLRLQPLQPGKIASRQRYLQADTHRRSRRVARTWYGIKGSYTGLAKTGSNLSDSTSIATRSPSTAQPIGVS